MIDWLKNIFHKKTEKKKKSVKKARISKPEGMPLGQVKREEKKKEPTAQADRIKSSKEKIKEKIETSIDNMLKLLEQKESISIEELAKELKVSEELIEEWAKILEEHQLVTIEYSLVGKPMLKIVKHNV
jgi:response regulator of citrate/malate metabolism